MGNKKLIYIVILLLMLSPLATSLLFVKGSAPDWLDTNNDWISFIGSFISSIVTIVGIGLTIKYTREQATKDRNYAKELADEDRRIQHIPYLKFDFLKYENINSTLIIAFDDDSNKDIYRNMQYKNVGLGPVIDLVIDIKQSENVGQSLRSSLIEIGEVNQISLEFKIKNDDIELATDSDGSLIPSPKMFRTRKRTIYISYKDILGNQYQQSIEMQILTNFIGNKGAWEYSEPTISIGESTKAKRLIL